MNPDAILPCRPVATQETLDRLAVSALEARANMMARAATAGAPIRPTSLSAVDVPASKPMTSESSLARLNAALASLGEQLAKSDPIADQMRIDEYEHSKARTERFKPAGNIGAKITQIAAQAIQMSVESMGIGHKHPDIDTVAMWERLRGETSHVSAPSIYRTVMEVINNVFDGNLQKYEEYLTIISLAAAHYSLLEVLKPDFAAAMKS